jgi:putative radical SAM enzyme (TIGR03279 family)
MSRNCNDTVIESVKKDSPGGRAGLQPGDIVQTVNRRKIRDSIDLLFYDDATELSISLKRKGRVVRCRIIRDEGENLGIELSSFRVRRCKNSCIFCFVNQLPQGLRKTLYVKDEDYRMSFLYGNYVTLSNLTSSDRRRIVEQRLSPLYVSVHTTNRFLRNNMLGNKNGADIMKEIGWLVRHRIRLHTQIVLCPGFNDGSELRKTINDLHSFYPYVCSIAVVPIGVTRYRKTSMHPVGREEAKDALKIVTDSQKRFMKKYGDALVHGSDELYIKAERKFPPLKYYGDFPQMENGVGMVPSFLSKIKRIQPPKDLSKKRFLTITGTSFYPYAKGFTDQLKERVRIKVVPVENIFFGKSVTVTGLLTGRDIIREISDTASEFDILLIPDVVLRDGGDMFLDNVKIADIERILKLQVHIFDSTPRGFAKALERIDVN